MPKQPSRQPPTTGSDEAVLPTRGALRPERTRAGAAEDPELGELARRAAESVDDAGRELDFEPPADKVREALDLDRTSELPDPRDRPLAKEELEELGLDDIESSKS